MLEENSAIVFATAPYQPLARLLRKSGQPIGEIRRKLFSDGEQFLQIVTPVRDRDVVLIAGILDDLSTLEVIRTAYTFVQQGARRLLIIIPYFAYSTMERPSKKPGEEGAAVTALIQARLLSVVPQAPMGTKFVMMDLHAAGIPMYFAQPEATDHIYCEPVILEMIDSIRKEDSSSAEFVLGSTDGGRADWVKSLADHAGLRRAIAGKNRSGSGEVKNEGIFGDVRGCHVILYDDMIRSGKTLIEAGQSYLEAGAKTLSVVATHGVFSDNAGQRLHESGLFRFIVVTDTHPNARETQIERITPGEPSVFFVCSVAGILRSYLFTA